MFQNKLVAQSIRTKWIQPDNNYESATPAYFLHFSAAMGMDTQQILYTIRAPYNTYLSCYLGWQYKNDNNNIGYTVSSFHYKDSDHKIIHLPYMTEVMHFNKLYLNHTFAHAMDFEILKNLNYTLLQDHLSLSSQSFNKRDCMQIKMKSDWKNGIHGLIIPFLGPVFQVLFPTL